MASSSASLVRGRGFRLVASVAIGAGVVALGVAHLVDLRRAGAAVQTITLSGPDTLGRGLQDVYRIQLSDPAPSPSGLDVTLAVNDPTSCVVAATENSTGGSSLTRNVGVGRRRASFVIQSLPAGPGDCSVYIASTNPAGWTGSALTVPIVQAKLRIRELVRTISSLAANQGFFVEAGVPNGNGASLRFIQGVSKGTPDVSVHVCSDQPAIGTIANRFGQDVPPAGCEDNPIRAPFSRTVPGDFQFDPDPNATGAGGDVNVSASAPGFLGDAGTVTVRAAAVTIRGPQELGAGLQANYSLTLSDAPATDLNVTVCSSAPAACAVAASEQSLARDCVIRTVSGGRYRTDFVVQGVTATAPGTPCQVTVTAGTFGSDTYFIDVVQPALRLRDLPATIGQFANDTPLFVELGVPGGRRTLRFVQQWRKGLESEAPRANLTVTVESDAPTVGTIVDRFGVDNGADGRETDDVTPGFSRTVPGNLQFDPIAGSDTPVKVTASAPGFVSDDDDIKVKAAALQINGGPTGGQPAPIGARLQDDFTVQLVAAGNHDAVDVTICSTIPDFCRVSASPNTAPTVDGGGANCIVRSLAADDYSAPFTVHAMDDAANADCPIQASANGYESANFTVRVVEPGIQIRALRRSFAVNDPNDGLFVEVGVPNASNTALRFVQRVRKGTADVAIRVCSSKKTVGTIVDRYNVDNGNDGCEDDLISQTFSQNVPNNLKFDPIGTGSTIVEATSAGFRPMDRTGRIEVRVGSDSVRLKVKDAVGAGLQEENEEVQLSKPAGAGGVTVTVSITDGTDANCKLSSNPAMTATASSVSIFIAEGDNTGTFVVAGLEGHAGTPCKLKAEATGFFDDTADIDVVAYGLQIIELPRTLGTTSPNVDFKVQIGVPVAGGGRLRLIQPVRIGGANVSVNVCSDTTSVGDIVGGSSGCKTMYIVPGAYEVIFSFDAIAVGRTKITAVGGNNSMDMLRVRVVTTAVRLQGPDQIGKDLEPTYNLILNNSGGATVRVSTSTPLVCAVPGVDISGQLVVSFLVGEQRKSFTVQGLALGVCTLQIALDGGATFSVDINVVPARLRIRGLSSSVGAQAPNDPFVVEIGPMNLAIGEVETNRDNRNGITDVQPVRSGAGPFTVQVCSSVVAAGKIKDPENGGTAACADSQLYAGANQTAEFQFDPANNVPAGNNQTVVDASVPAVAEIRATRVDVNVRPDGLSIRGPDAIGLDLQDSYRVVLGKPAPAGGVVVSLTADSSTRCKISATENGGAVSALAITIAEGDRSGEFFLRGLQSSLVDPCKLAATAGGYKDAKKDVAVRDATYHIAGLDRSVSPMDDPDQFDIQIGVRDGRFIQQALRADAAAPVTVQACVDNLAVGQLVGGSADANPNCRNAVIYQGADTTNQLSLKPKTDGTVCVSVPGDQVCVDVNASNIRIAGPGRLGSGLQDNYGLRLGKKPTTSVTVNVCVVGDATAKARCRVAATESSAGTECIAVPIEAGKRVGEFWVQGMEPNMGLCTVQADAGAQFHVGTKAIDIVMPAYQLSGLRSRQALTGANDNFLVEIGVTNNAQRRLTAMQALRYNYKTPPGPSSVNPVVCAKTQVPPIVPGVIVGGVADADPDCRKGTINQQQSSTAEFSFDPLATGATEVCVREVANFFPTQAACVPVVVGDLVLSLDTPNYLGAGLQDEASVRLGQKAPAPYVDVTIKTLTPLHCKVANDTVSANADQITERIDQGNVRAMFEIRALGLEGECLIEASSPGRTTDSARLVIQKPALRITDLNRSVTTPSSDDRFSVDIGVPDGNLRGLRIEQQLSYAGAGQRIEACSGEPGVGTIPGGDPHPDVLKTNCRSTIIAAGDSDTDVFSFHPVTVGDTVVCVACIDDAGVPSPACQAIRQSCRNVHVSQASIAVNAPRILGGGLQDNAAAVLGKAAPAGGVNVTIRSDTPTRCKVAHTFQEDGVDQLAPMPVLQGHTRVEFVVQGVYGAMGECVITATAPNYSDGAKEIDVRMPALAIRGLRQNVGAPAADDPFRVEVGPVRENLTCITSPQAVAINGGLTVYVCGSDNAVGIIKGGSYSSATCRYATIAKGQSFTDAFAFDPIAAGVAIVDASSPQIQQRVTCDTVPVNVRNANLTLNGPDSVGAYLQDDYRAVFSMVPPAGTTVSVATGPNCRCSATEDTAGSQNVTIPVPAGRARVDFWIQGIFEGGCPLTLTTNATGYNSDSDVLDIVRPGVRLRGLDTSSSTLAANDPFFVDIGVPSGNLRTLSLLQEVRPGASVPIKVCSSDTNVGVIAGGNSDPSDAKCRKTAIAALHNYSDAFAFDAGNAGTTTVDVREDGVPLVVTDKGSLDVTVAAESVRISGSDTIGAGLQDGYVVLLSKVASSLTTVTLTSLTPGICYVAASEAVEGGTTAQVTIQSGRARADFAIQALEGVEGDCEVTAAVSLAGYTAADQILSVVAPGLRIVNLDTSRSTQSADDPFNVESGVPNTNRTNLRLVQALRFRTSGGGVNVTVCSSDPNVGKITPASGPSAACQTVPIAAGKSRTAEGALKFDAINGGSTIVSATAPGFGDVDAVSKDVTVSELTTTVNGPDSLGATLEDQYTLALSGAVAADTTFTITSNSTAVCKLSVNETDLAQNSITVIVPKGRSRAYFWVHGWDITGTCSLSVSTATSGISPGYTEIQVVTPGLRLYGVPGSIKTAAADDPFVVQLGVPASNLKNLSVIQERRAGLPLTVMACSSDDTKATIVGAGPTAACNTATVAANKDATDSTALKLHPVLAGNIIVSASAPGFTPVDAAYKDVVVSQATINLTGPDAIGAGLQDTFTATLSSTAPTGGVPITLVSETPANCLVAKDEATSGAATYATTIAKGHSYVKFAVQALESAANTNCRISVSSSNAAYSPDVLDISIRQLAARIRLLDPTTTIVAANDSFNVDVGVARDNLSTLRLIQTVRAGAPALVVPVCSSVPAVAAVVGTATADPACKSATIAAGDSATVNNALQLDALTAGSTTVYVALAGAITTDAGSVDVVVAPAALSVVELAADRIGAGLMDTFRVKSSAAVGSAASVTVTSNTPTICQVAVSESTAPAASVVVTINAGGSYVNFAIHGVEAQSGACKITASSGTFADGIGLFDVVQPALRISYLSTSKGSTATDDAFYVDIGTPKSGLTNIQTLQKVRIGSAGVVVTVCSSDPNIGLIVTAAGAAACEPVTIVAGSDGTASNAVKFRVVGNGPTTVEASAPNHITTDAGTVDVTVTGFALAVKNTSTTATSVGAGLQQGTFYVERSGSTTSAETITVTSLTPSICVLSVTGTTAGTTSISVSVAAAATISSSFFVQGLENVVGTCQMQATNPNYAAGTGSTNVVTAGIRITNLATTVVYTAANDPFNVEMGVPVADQSDLSYVQPVRGGSAGFDITVTNSSAAVAQLVSAIGPSPGQTVTVNVGAGTSSNSGQLEFDPIAAGGTSVVASHPSAISATTATVTVAVTSGGGC